MRGNSGEIRLAGFPLSFEEGAGNQANLQFERFGKVAAPANPARYFVPLITAVARKISFDTGRNRKDEQMPKLNDEFCES
jgi:hypothetical protein